MNRQAITAKAGAAFDKVRSMLNADKRMFLLRRAGETSKFTAIAEITATFWSRWSEFRQSTVFMISTDDQTLTDWVSMASHIGYGSVDNAGQLEVYELSPDQRDRTEPSDAKVMWKIYADRVAHERYTLPTPDPEP